MSGSVKYLPPAVVMALELDDPSVIAVAERHGVTVVGLTVPDAGFAVEYNDAGRAWLIDECEAHSTAEYDLPFGVRMACKRVARDLRGRLNA